MRYVHGLVCVCALLVAMPLSASAQDSEEDGSWLERWHPEAVEDPAKPAPEPASEEPALELKLGADGVLLNTGIAGADDCVSMARAMNLALEAGYLSARAGRIPRKLYATASSPVQGVIGAEGA